MEVLPHRVIELLLRFKEITSLKGSTGWVGNVEGILGGNDKLLDGVMSCGRHVAEWSDV